MDHLNPAVYGDCIESYYEYKPGEGYNYSNMGLNLAGTILEKVSGVRFDNYVKENVIQKLGLYGGRNIDSLDANKFALIYKPENGKYVASEGAYKSRSSDMLSYIFGCSSPIFSLTGGVKISAHDLAIYMMMHMNYGENNGTRIISEESAKIMQTPIRVSQDATAPNMLYNVPGNYLIGHTGGAYGLNSIMIWSPSDNWGIVAITNGFTAVDGKSFLKSIIQSIYNACVKEDLE